MTYFCFSANQSSNVKCAYTPGFNTTICPEESRKPLPLSEFKVIIYAVIMYEKCEQSGPLDGDNVQEQTLLHMSAICAHEKSDEEKCNDLL